MIGKRSLTVSSSLFPVTLPKREVGRVTGNREEDTVSDKERGRHSEEETESKTQCGNQTGRHSVEGTLTVGSIQWGGCREEDRVR